jgi:transposase
LTPEQEQLQLGTRERDRLKVLHEVEQGHLKQWQAAQQLGLSERGLRKLLRRYRERGDRAVVHGLRGRRSNRSMEPKVARVALRLVQSEYGDFGPTLASEYLRREHGIGMSRETLRKLLTAAGLWKPKKQKLRQVHVWRARRSCRGELVQWDTSVHAWLEGRGSEKMYLVGLIDDATSQLFARFVTADSTAEHMRVLWGYLERHGRPQAVYTDQPTVPRGWREEEPGPRGETQLGRALRELGIEWIAAYSPQAKGRVERCFGTLQDRLVKALRKAGVKTLEAANDYLEKEFLPMWNARFAQPPACEVDGHRPIRVGTDLASHLSIVEKRQVANDYTVRWEGRRWQIPRAAVRPGLRRSTIRVEQRLDGSMMARVGEGMVRLERCEARLPEIQIKEEEVAKRYIPAPGESRWMDRFRVKGNPAWKAWREEQARTVSPPLRSPSGLPARR